MISGLVLKYRKGFLLLIQQKYQVSLKCAVYSDMTSDFIWISEMSNHAFCLKQPF